MKPKMAFNMTAQLMALGSVSEASLISSANDGQLRTVVLRSLHVTHTYAPHNQSLTWR